ncbi:CD109 antigen-like isoform X2 [Glandiceps talaboti]
MMAASQLTVLLLCISSLIISVQGENSYIVLCPKTIRPGVPFTVSVNILQSNGQPVTVMAALGNKDTDTPVVRNTLNMEQGELGEIQLTLPTDTSVNSYQLTVSGSGGLTFENSTDITIDSKSFSILIQTDKAIYKPGQTVKYRALAMYPYTGTYTGKFDIEIKDPQDNMIQRNTDLQDSVYGVVEGELITSTQPLLGDWTIIVTATETGQAQEKVFTIEEYVLPKFEVKVTLPSFAVEQDRKVVGTVKSEYTYGKPVKGTVVLKAQLTRYVYGRSLDEIQNQYIEQTKEIDGETDFEFSMTDIQNILNNRAFPDGDILTVEAKVTEKLTGISQSAEAEMNFYSLPVKMEFLPISPNTYKPGMKYTAFLSVTLMDGQPLRQEDVKIVKIHWDGPATAEEYIIPPNGIVTITLDALTTRSRTIYISAEYGTRLSETHTVTAAESPSDNYIQITTTTDNLKAGDTATFTVKATEPFSSYFLEVLSRGNIAAVHVIQGAALSVHTYDLVITSAMAPTAQVVVYYVRNDGEVVIDSLTINVKGAFDNKVTVAFNKDTAEPSENIQVDVTASPNSFVAILAVDQSVLLLKSGNDITESEAVESLRSFDTSVGGGNFNPDVARRMYKRSASPVRSKRDALWWMPWTPGGLDAYSIITNAGLLVLSDAGIYRTTKNHFNDFDYVDELQPGIAYDMMERVPVAANADDGATFEKAESGGDANLQPVEKVRKIFPETWFWTDSISGEDGRAVFTGTVPDTITSWVASAFSVSTEDGFGVSPTTTSMDAFKPFFVSLSLPYSVVRGEELAMKALVFNYQTYDMEVTVTLEQSNDFMNVLLTLKDNEEVAEYVSEAQIKKVTVAAGEGKSLSFPIKPTKLGPIPIKIRAQSTTASDALERILLVEPEGVAHDYAYNTLLDLDEGDSIEENVYDINLPSVGLVEGSVVVKFSAVGDIMGTTLNNLDALLRVPTGCGEQTMIGFAPDVFVYKYLEATGLDNQEIRALALRYMKTGYQRELTYKHEDGSFSAFGKHDDSGSSWLTAFVVKCFVQAMDFIPIDPSVLIRAIEWLIKTQGDSGAFLKVGRVVDTIIKGGISGDVAMTSFVVIALSQSHQNLDKEMSLVCIMLLGTAKNDAKIYLERQLDSVDDTYTLAIMTLALHYLESAHKDSAFSKLNQKATTENGLMYWTDEDDVTDDKYRYPAYFAAVSADIEITSYALLTYNLRSDYNTAALILRWLIKNSNSLGGYRSTQDTVLAIEGMSEVAISMKREHQNLVISLTSSEMPSYQPEPVRITTDNSLILHQVILPVTSGSVTVNAVGSGIALIHVIVSYNIETQHSNDAFNVVIVTHDVNKNRIEIGACASYLNDGSSGMAVMEVGVPSGFYAIEESLTKLINNGENKLKRTEQEDRKVVFYFDEIGPEETCVNFPVLRLAAVAKSQPTAVRVYDYYKPEKKGSVMYVSETLQNTGICDVCDDCGDGCMKITPTSNKPKMAATFPLFASMLFIALAILYQF